MPFYPVPVYYAAVILIMAGQKYIYSEGNNASDLPGIPRPFTAGGKMRAGVV
jgi:hypothetical protein